MDAGEREGSSPEPLNHISDLLLQLDESERGLRDQLQAYANDPSRAASQQVVQGGAALGKTLNTVVREIAADEELTESERANSIATVYLEVRGKQVELFEAKAPEGNYHDSFLVQEQVAQDILDHFKDGLDAEDIANETETSYMVGFRYDLEEFSDFLEPSKKVKAKSLTRQAGEHAVDVGKISAGVLIGGFILQKINEKFGK